MLHKFKRSATSELIQDELIPASCESLWATYVTNTTKVLGNELLEIRLPGLNAFTVQLKTKAVVNDDIFYILSEISYKIAREIQHQNAFY
jgi:hypothetical protein